jgi:hypothetical protein
MADALSSTAAMRAFADGYNERSNEHKDGQTESEFACDKYR